MKEVYKEPIVWCNAAGEYHREDGPAIEYADGCKSWWINGKLHREDGPAIEYTDDYKEWWLNGKIYLLDEYIELISEENRDKILFNLNLY